MNNQRISDIQNKDVRDVTKQTEDGVFFEALVQKEVARCIQESTQERPRTLADLEKTYFGSTVGHARRAIQKQMIDLLPLRPKGESNVLLDYGFGGDWFKDGYWPLFSKVIAVEVNPLGIEQVRGKWDHVELCITKNGLINIKNECDILLSSSVIGYIHPEHAKAHLRCSFDALKPGGTLILTRLKAYNIFQALHGTKMLFSGKGFSFEYSYRRHELEALLCQAGFTDIEYLPQGVWFSRFERFQQLVYKWWPTLPLLILPRIFPYAKLHHFLIAKKPIK